MKNKTTKIKTGFEGTDIKKAVKHRYGQLANNHGATVFQGAAQQKVVVIVLSLSLTQSI